MRPLENPTPAELRELARASGDEVLRWIEDAAGNRFVWPASAGGHRAAAAQLGIAWPWRQGLIEVTAATPAGSAAPRSRPPSP